MARPRKFGDDALLDAALTVVGRQGPQVTIAGIAAELGAPVGSLYHRVSGRDELLGRLWLREIDNFQRDLLPLTQIEDPHAAMDAAVRHIPRWCDGHRTAARVLTLFRQVDLVACTEGEVREQAIHVNDTITAAMGVLARRRYGRATPERVAILRIACQRIPYDLVRPHVGGGIPDWLEDAAVAAAHAVAERGQ